MRLGLLSKVRGEGSRKEAGGGIRSEYQGQKSFCGRERRKVYKHNSEFTLQDRTLRWKHTQPCRTRKLFFFLSGWNVSAGVSALRKGDGARVNQ